MKLPTPSKIKPAKPLKAAKTKGKPKIVPGLKIHHWTVVARLPLDRKTKSPNLRRRVRVKCVCGNVQVLPLYYLQRKNPKMSCGCMNRSLAANNKLEYRVWYMMNVRCTNPKHKSYKDYGGRGIEVCERWSKTNPHGFANFLKDMGPRKWITLTLDRIDVNGPYAPEWNGKKQCRWATWDEQAANKRPIAPPPEQEGYEEFEDLRAVDQQPEAPEENFSCEPIEPDPDDAGDDAWDPKSPDNQDDDDDTDVDLED